VSCHQGFFSLQGKAPKEIEVIMTETLDIFLPRRATDLSATRYCPFFGFYVYDDSFIFTA